VKANFPGLFSSSHRSIHYSNGSQITRPNYPALDKAAKCKHSTMQIFHFLLA